MMKKQMVAVIAALAGAAVWAYGPYDDELPYEEGWTEADCFSAANGYVKHTIGEAANGSVYIYSFTTNIPKKWAEDATAPHAGAKYYVPANTLVTSNPQDTPKGTVIWFAGDRLVIGKGGRLQCMTTGNNTPEIEHLFMLGGSELYWSNPKGVYQGNMHVRRCGGSDEVRFSSNYQGLNQAFAMTVDGDNDQKVVFTAVLSDAKEGRNVTWRMTGDWSNYSGSVLVTNPCCEANWTKLLVNGPEFPTDVTLTRNCLFGANAANGLNLRKLTMRSKQNLEIAANAQWSVGDLVIDEDVTMVFKSRTSSLTVTDSFAIASGSLRLKFEGAAFDGGADVNPQTITPIVFGPDVDLEGVTIDSFILEGFVKANTAPTVTYALVRDEETGETRLVATRKPIIVRTSAAETNDPLSSHFWCAERNASNEFCWTDHQAPHAGADYTLSKGATPPTTGDNSVPFVFGGDSLTISADGTPDFIITGGRLKYWDLKDLRIGGTKNRVLFRSYNGDLPAVPVNGTTLHAWEFRGKTTIGEKVWVKHSPYVTTCLHLVKGEQVGAGSIQLSSFQGAAKKATNSGRIKLDALNTNFTGRIYFNHPFFHQDATSASRETYDIPDKDVHVWLYMSDGRNLGGPLPAFSYNSLSVNDWGRLATVNELSNDLVLDQANRGIWVGWVGQFDVYDAATTLTIKNPLTLAGNLYKRGAGTLVLASQLRFAENNDVNDIGTPRANSNLVTVTEGALKVAHAHALDGAAVSFAADTKLVIPVDADATSDLAKFGAINVKGNGGFSSTAADGKIPVAFDYGDMPIAMLPISGQKVAICTVNGAEASAALCDKFSILPRIGVNAVLSSEATEGIDGAYTVYATLTFTGLTVTENCSMDGSKLTLELDITDVGGADKLTVELKQGDNVVKRAEVASLAVGKQEVVFDGLTNGDYTYQIKLTGTYKGEDFIREEEPVAVSLAEPSSVTPKDGKFVLSANAEVDMASTAAGFYAVSSAPGKKCHLKWTDDKTGNGKYAVMNGQTLTVKEGQPKNGMDSFMSYVLGLDPDESTAKPYMASVQTDNPNEFTFTLPNINPKSESETGVAVKYDLIASTEPTFATGKKTLATATENQLSCTLPSEKVTYYKVEINLK